MAEPSILGALRDPQFRSDTLRNLVEALNGAKRSLTVGSLGAVGDMGSTLANLVRAGAGTAYHEATGRPIPQALEYRDPARDFGTSASLGNFAESQGWLPPQTYSMPEQAGALLGPIAAMKAPDLAQSTLRGLVSALKSEPSRRTVEGLVDGVGARPKIFAGEGAQTADMQALAKAQQLEKAGAPERAIWSDTGWFKGADGKWRFEIDDSGASFIDRFKKATPQDFNDFLEAKVTVKEVDDMKRAAREAGGFSIPKFYGDKPGLYEKYIAANKKISNYESQFMNPTTTKNGLLGDFIDHDKLDAAYPDLYNISTVHNKNHSGGAYYPEQNRMLIGGGNEKSITLHELQHAVQQREGFAKGGNPNMMTPDSPEVAKMIRDLEMQADAAREAGNKAAYMEATDARAKLLREDGYGGYRALAGEAEARAVQSRMDMTPEQRRASFPFDSYDVPRDSLIIRK